MPASQDQVSATGEDWPKSFTKFVRRASRALHPKASPGSSGGDPSQGETSASLTSVPVPSTQAEAAAAVAVRSATFEEVVPRIDIMEVHRAGPPTATVVPRPEIKDLRSLGKNQQEKAQLLFAKYGLTLDDRDWTSPGRSGVGQVQWVEKKIRVRVHRQCHGCGTSFGSAKECVSCSHVRCKKCPRWPPKSGMETAMPPTEGLRTIKQELLSAAPTAANTDAVMNEIQVTSEVVPSAVPDGAVLEATMPIDLQVDSSEQDDLQLRRATSTTHQRRGADVVYRPPVQRVRRFCHVCETLFKGRSATCESCGHPRCSNCPREPHKPVKFASGYPGDAPEPEPTYPALERVWRKPRTRVRYTCEHCHTVFSNSGEKSCKNCKHARCSDCIRDPPRRPAKRQSEELLKSLEGKFTGLQLLTEKVREGVSDESQPVG